MSPPTPFHRIFGYYWIDFFVGTDVEVETEVDLSIKQQRLDLLIFRKGRSPIPWPLPDGFDVLRTYNLLTFKSFQEALDLYTLQELVGHFVNYRKRVSPSLDELLPGSEFQLFAVCARAPEKLAKEVGLVAVRPGVYDASGFGLTIRVIVCHELPKEAQNAMLHLFSARADLIAYGQEHYRPHSPGTSTLINLLLKEYTMSPKMIEKLREFNRQGLEEILKDLTVEERLKGVTPDELRRALPLDERLKGVTPDELRRALPLEERLKGATPEEVIRALPPEVLEGLARKLKNNGNSPEPQ